MRGFQIAKGFEDCGIALPVRQTNSSAGYDLASIEDIVIKPFEIAIIKTGLKAYMNSDEVLKIYPRSSLPIKKGLMLANSVGIVDADYYNNDSNDGHIMVMVYNFTNKDASISKGERIAQGIFEKYLKADADFVGGKRIGGFGSTKL